MWDDIVKAGGGPIVFNATMMDGGDILALSKTHVVVSCVLDDDCVCVCERTCATMDVAGVYRR